MTTESLIAVCLAIAGPVFALWKSVSSFEHSLKVHAETLTEIKETLSKLPAMSERVAEMTVITENHANFMSKFASTFPKLDSRISVLEARVQSIKDMQRVQSRHEWQEDNK